MAAFNKEKLLKNAQKLVSQGKLENAIREYEKILEHEPNDLGLLNTIGDLNLSLQRPANASSFFKRVAQKYIDDGFYSRAIAVYRKIVMADNRNMENLEVLADLFIKEGMVSEAKKHYAEIARSYLVSNNFPRAYKTYKKLADLTQDDPNIHLKLAELSLKLEMLDNARESYLNAAVISSRRGNPQQALNSIKMALEIDPFHMGSLKTLFKISLELQDFGLLTDKLEAAQTRASDNRELMEMLGQCYMFQGELQKAYDVFAAIFELDPSKYFLLYDLSESALKLTHYELAGAAISKVADIMLSRKENLKLLETLEAITSQDPLNVVALQKLSDIYQILSDNFKYFSTLEKLVEALMRRKQYPDALQVLEQVLNIEPNNDKLRTFHREAFAKVYPNETYTPFGGSGEEVEEESAALFEFDTSELSSGTATPAAGDVGLEIELLLSYGLKDKAKLKLQEKIKEDPNDTILREKLKNLCKEEGSLKQAADLCFELVNLLTLRGEHDRAAAFLEEGRGLDPTRGDISIPTGALGQGISFPEEMDTSSTGFELLELEDSIDLTNDLSEILVGPRETAPAKPVDRPPVKPKAPEEPPAKPSAAPAKPPVEPAPPPVQKPTSKAPTSEFFTPLPEIDSDINLRLEETLRSIDDLDFLTKLGTSSLELPGTPAHNVTPEPEPTVAEASIDGLQSLKDLPTRSEAPSDPTPPAAQAPADNREVLNALQEIDFYIKLGFNDNAREELLQLQKRYPDSPEIQDRLSELTEPEPVEEPAEPETIEEEVAFKPRIEIQEIPRPDITRAAAPAEESAADEEVTPDDVNIDLFSMIAADSMTEDTERPSSSYQVRKMNPNMEGAGAPAADEAPANPFSDLKADDVLDNSFLFGEEKTSLHKKPDGLFVPTEQEAVREDKNEPGKALSSMHNIFSDIVEEANKVFVGEEVDEGDFETHYNLGCAYKEMGLLDDSIAAFQKAYNCVKDQQTTPNFIKACSMLSVCFIEKGLYKSALKWCERGVQSKGHEDHEYQALKFDMARSYEMLEDYQKALDVYSEIYAEDINYRDVAEKIKALRIKIK